MVMPEFVREGAKRTYEFLRAAKVPVGTLRNTYHIRTKNDCEWACKELSCELELQFIAGDVEGWSVAKWMYVWEKHLRKAQDSKTGKTLEFLNFPNGELLLPMRADAEKSGDLTSPTAATLQMFSFAGDVFIFDLIKLQDDYEDEFPEPLAEIFHDNKIQKLWWGMTSDRQMLKRAYGAKFRLREVESHHDMQYKMSQGDQLPGLEAMFEYCFALLNTESACAYFFPQRTILPWGMTLVGSLWEVPKEVRASFTYYAATDAAMTFWLSIFHILTKERYPHRIPRHAQFNWHEPELTESYEKLRYKFLVHADVVCHPQIQKISYEMIKPEGIDKQVYKQNGERYMKVQRIAENMLVYYGPKFHLGDAIQKDEAWNMAAVLAIYAVRAADKKVDVLKITDEMKETTAMWIKEDEKGVHKIHYVTTHCQDILSGKTGRDTEICDFSARLAALVPPPMMKAYLDRWEKNSPGFRTRFDPIHGSKDMRKKKKPKNVGTTRTGFSKPRKVEYAEEPAVYAWNEEMEERMKRRREATGDDMAPLEISNVVHVPTVGRPQPPSESTASEEPKKKKKQVFHRRPRVIPSERFGDDQYLSADETEPGTSEQMAVEEVQFAQEGESAVDIRVDTSMAFQPSQLRQTPEDYRPRHPRSVFPVHTNAPSEGRGRGKPWRGAPAMGFWGRPPSGPRPGQTSASSEGLARGRAKLPGEADQWSVPVMSTESVVSTVIPAEVVIPAETAQDNDRPEGTIQHISPIDLTAFTETQVPIQTSLTAVTEAETQPGDQGLLMEWSVSQTLAPTALEESIEAIAATSEPQVGTQTVEGMEGVYEEASAVEATVGVGHMEAAVLSFAGEYTPQQRAQFVLPSPPRPKPILDARYYSDPANYVGLEHRAWPQAEPLQMPEVRVIHNIEADLAQQVVQTVQPPGLYEEGQQAVDVTKEPPLMERVQATMDQFAYQTQIRQMQLDPAVMEEVPAGLPQADYTKVLQDKIVHLLSRFQTQVEFTRQLLDEREHRIQENYTLAEHRNQAYYELANAHRRTASLWNGAILVGNDAIPMPRGTQAEQHDQLRVSIEQEVQEVIRKEKEFTENIRQARLARGEAVPLLPHEQQVIHARGTMQPGQILPIFVQQEPRMGPVIQEVSEAPAPLPTVVTHTRGIQANPLALSLRNGEPRTPVKAATAMESMSPAEKQEQENQNVRREQDRAMRALSEQISDLQFKETVDTATRRAREEVDSQAMMEQDTQPGPSRPTGAISRVTKTKAQKKHARRTTQAEPVTQLFQGERKNLDAVESVITHLGIGGAARGRATLKDLIELEREPRNPQRYTTVRYIPQGVLIMRPVEPRHRPVELMDEKPDRVPIMKLLFMAPDDEELGALPEGIAPFVYAVDLIFKYIEKRTNEANPLNMGQVVEILEWLAQRTLTYCLRWIDVFCKRDFELAMVHMVQRMKELIRTRTSRQRGRLAIEIEVQQAIDGTEGSREVINIPFRQEFYEARTGSAPLVITEKEYDEEKLQQAVEGLFDLDKPPLEGYSKRELAKAYWDEQRLKEMMMRITSLLTHRATYIEALLDGESPEQEQLKQLTELRTTILTTLRREMDPRITKPVALLPLNLSTDLIHYLQMIIQQYPVFGKIVTVEVHGQEGWNAKAQEYYPKLLGIEEYLKQIGNAQMIAPEPIEGLSYYEQQLRTWQATVILTSARTMAPLALDRMIHQELVTTNRDVVDEARFLTFDEVAEKMATLQLEQVSITETNQPLAGEFGGEERQDDLFVPLEGRKPMRVNRSIQVSQFWCKHNRAVNTKLLWTEKDGWKESTDDEGVIRMRKRSQTI